MGCGALTAVWYIYLLPAEMQCRKNEQPRLRLWEVNRLWLGLRLRGKCPGGSDGPVCAKNDPAPFALAPITSPCCRGSFFFHGSAFDPGSGEVFQFRPGSELDIPVAPIPVKCSDSADRVCGSVYMTLRISDTGYDTA